MQRTSSFIAAIIILLLHKWIPEFIISIIYTGNLVGKKIRDIERTNIDDTSTLNPKQGRLDYNKIYFKGNNNNYELILKDI